MCSQLVAGRMGVWHFIGVPAVNPASMHPRLRSQSVCLSVDFSSCQSLIKLMEQSERGRKKAVLFNVCLNVFRFSLEAVRRLWKKMEAINVICSPDTQGQPLVYRLDSLGDRVCVCGYADDAGVLDKVQGSGPPGLPGFLPFHPSHSLQRAASTHPRLCPPNFNLEKKKRRSKINKTDNLGKIRSSDVIHQFQFWPFSCLLICLHVLSLEVHISGGGFQTAGN